MIYVDFINSEKNNNLKLAKEIFDKNKLVYKIEGSSIEAYSSIVVSLKMILRLSNKEIKNDIIFDGQKDGSIDAIYLDKKNKVIHIFDVKKTDKFERNEIINDFLGEFRRNFLNFRTDLKPLNELACSKISIARNNYHDKKYKVAIYFVRLGFCGDCSKIRNTYKENIEKEFVQCRKPSYNFIGSKELVDKYLNKKQNNFHEELVFDDNNVFYDTENKVAIGKIKIKDIIEMVNKAESTGSYNIFDDNVRVDQEKEDLDNDLIKTLNNNGDRFFLFHNGITISGLDSDSAGGKKFSLVHPQILNGCQSVKSLQRISINHQKLIDNALILCRLFEGKGSDDINAVCQSTNSQKPIHAWDLRTNDLIQKVLEDLLAKKGYPYNRKIIRRGGMRKITITDLAQWIESCINDHTPGSNTGGICLAGQACYLNKFC